jgi:6-phosphogluconate dehydrogenase
MPGGEFAAWQELKPIWEAVAAKVDAKTGKPLMGATPGKPVVGGVPCTTYIGANGAGHYVKMVHNGIEYGIMAAYGEGLNIIKHANVGSQKQEDDAETTPLRQPELYQYDIDTGEVAEVWRRGSVIASWLLDLTAIALKRDSELSDFTGRVSDSGEGRWTAIAAIDEGVPAYVLTNSLFERFESRGEGDYAGKIMSAMRMEFGGHHEKPGS